MIQSDPSFAPSELLDTILLPDGTVDVNKFTNSMLQSNILMTKALTQSNRLASNVDKLKEKRLIEHPPSLSSSANYVEYMTWMDLILANLKRHSYFRYDQQM